MHTINENKSDLPDANNRIYDYMRQMGYESVSSLCRANPGLNEVAVGLLLNMKKAAVKNDGRWSAPAEHLATALCCELNDLWPDAQRTVALKTNEYSVELSEEEAARIVYADQETVLFTKERGVSIEKTLKSLTEREEKLLRLRHGFAPYYKAHSTEEIAKIFEVSDGRIHQIEQRAIRRLQHHKTKKKLIDFSL